MTTYASQTSRAATTLRHQTRVEPNTPPKFTLTTAHAKRESSKNNERSVARFKSRSTISISRKFNKDFSVIKSADEPDVALIIGRHGRSFMRRSKSWKRGSERIGLSWATAERDVSVWHRRAGTGLRRR